MNFQDIHTYYQQLNIGQFFPHMLCKGEALSVAANKKFTVEPGYIYFCTEGSLTILMPDDGLNIGNTIEYMPIGLMERYCPLAKYEYRSSAKVKLVRIAWADFDQLFFGGGCERMQALATILTYMSISPSTCTMNAGRSPATRPSNRCCTAISIGRRPTRERMRAWRCLSLSALTCHARMSFACWQISKPGAISP